MALLGHIVSSEGIKEDPRKIEVVQSRPRPSSATEIQSFLGLVRYYRRLVENFLSIVALLIRLTKKGARFRWSDEYRYRYVLMKEGRMIAYASRLLKPREKTYHVHDLELAALLKI
ncbi:uncharacterized mitochondrial protein AtMg00860-like [Nicotiana tomentosiformis]|uniref:uncharacterized mitochondrial protein AtMg00860-like n=1 Tax=Nicotiana tomentosiformis TaxID=4098 RepID=UPI00388C6C45